MFDPIQNLKDFFLTCNQFVFVDLIIDLFINLLIYLLVVFLFSPIYWVMSYTRKFKFSKYFIRYLLSAIVLFEIFALLVTYYYGVASFPLFKLFQPLDCVGYNGISYLLFDSRYT